MAIHIEVGPAIHLEQMGIKLFDVPSSLQSDFTEYLSHPDPYYCATEGYVVGCVNELITIDPNIPPIGNVASISYLALTELLKNTPLVNVDDIYGKSFFPLTENLVIIFETASKEYLKDWVPKPNCNGVAALWLQHWPRYVLNKYRNPIIRFS